MNRPHTTASPFVVTCAIAALVLTTACATKPPAPNQAVTLPRGMAHDREAFRFLVCDGEWSQDRSLARPVFAGIDPDIDVSWNQHLQCFVAMTGRTVAGEGVFEIAARGSRRPEGPYGDPVVLARLPLATGFARGPRGVRAHPHLFREQRRIMVGSVIDPLSGRPRSWEVEFP